MNRVQSGVCPNPYDLRDYSHERTFGTLDPKVFPDEYNADLALEFPDQNAEGLPNGCTGFTQAEIAQDENGKLLDHANLYKDTLIIANRPDGQPVQMRDSFRATRVYGIRERASGDKLRRGAYFDVDKNGDYFDGARSALFMNRLHHRTISAATPWYWGSVGKSGIMQDVNMKRIPNVWHNWKICGWKTINGEPHLIVKAWCGPQWGDAGYGYISRAVFNKLMKISGTAMYVQGNATPEEVKTIKLDVMEFILELYRRLKRLGSWFAGS